MTDFTLKYDGTTDQLVGEDPNGNEIAVPFESVDVSDGTITQRFGDSRRDQYIAYKDGSETVIISRDGEVQRETDANVAFDQFDNNASQGYHIHLTTGVYPFRGTYADGNLLNVQTDGATWTGEGRGSEMQWQPSTRVDDAGVRLTKVDGNNVTFRNFYLNSRVDEILAGNFGPSTVDTSDDGHNNASSGTNFLFQGMYSWNSTGDGVEPGLSGGGNNTLITGCHFKDNFEQNVHLNGCNDTIVDGCHLEGGRSNGQVSLFSLTPTKNCVISNCVITGGEVNGINITATGGGTVTGLTIVDNRISTPERGISSFTSSSASSVPTDITIRGNTIVDAAANRDTKASAILLTAGEDITIKDNKIIRPKHNGIRIDSNQSINGVGVKDVVVTDNEIIDPVYNVSSPSGFQSDGMLFRENSAPFEHLTVRDNRIISKDADSQLGDGILSDVAGGIVEITGNTVRGQSEGVVKTFDDPAYLRDNRPAVPTDVRSLKDEEGNRAYHDGTNSNTVGPAFYDGSSWISLVDGSTIS